LFIGTKYIKNNVITYKGDKIINQVIFQTVLFNKLICFDQPYIRNRFVQPIYVRTRAYTCQTLLSKQVMPKSRNKDHESNKNLVSVRNSVATQPINFMLKKSAA